MEVKKKAKREDVLPGITTVTDGQESLHTKTKRNGAVVYDESPFLVGYKIDTRKKMLTVDRGTTYLKPGTRESEEAVTTVQQTVEVDQKQFVKIFSGEDLKMVYNLTSPGLKMFIAFIDLIGRPSQMNTTYVRCTWNIINRMTRGGADKDGFSYQTYNRGMKDLLDKGYIAAADIEGDEDCYWINQNFFYHGNTVTLQKKIILSKRNKEHEPVVQRRGIPDTQTLSIFDNGDGQFSEDNALGNDVPPEDDNDAASR